MIPSVNATWLLWIFIPTKKYPTPNVAINPSRECKKNKVGGAEDARIEKISGYPKILRIKKVPELTQLKIAPTINMYL